VGVRANAGTYRHNIDKKTVNITASFKRNDVRVRCKQALSYADTEASGIQLSVNYIATDVALLH
jgi:hypothetical protein